MGLLFHIAAGLCILYFNIGAFLSEYRIKFSQYFEQYFIIIRNLLVIR